MLLDNLLLGVQIAFTIPNILIAFGGVVLGISFGALPGLTATMGLAILIPFTYAMDPVTGLIFLASCYCGSFYGGAITAILLHTPGAPAAAITAIDGYAMTKKGQADEALSSAITASFWGGIISATVLLLLAPPLAQYALKFGPQERFMLAVFGLTIIASLSTKSMLKGLVAGIFGLMIGIVGADPMTAFPRFTFGSGHLGSGVPLLPALIGIYSTSQAMDLVSYKTQTIINEDATLKTKTKKFKLSLIFAYPVQKLRSALIGTFVGIIPGAGGIIGSSVSYNQGRLFSKHPEEFGNGSAEGVVCSEAANNGVTGGSLVPMLTLGIPGNAVTAILLGGLLIQGLVPGNELFTTKAYIAYPFILGLFIANFIMLFVGLFGSKYFVKITKVKINIIVAGILVLAVMGSYALGGAMADVYVMLIFGLIGYFLKRFDFQPTPIMLGFILGPIAEIGFVQSLIKQETISNAFLSILSRPISLILVILSILSIVAPLVQESRQKKKMERADNGK